MVEQALPEQLVAAEGGAKKRRRSKEDMGYNLSSRRPSGDHLKHKYTIDEDGVKAGGRDQFFQALTSTRAEGGNRKVICAPTTAEMHCGSTRQPPVAPQKPFLNLTSSYFAWPPYLFLTLFPFICFIFDHSF